MPTLKEFLKSVDVKNTDWEKFDWSGFNLQEIDTSGLNRDEVVKLNVVQGFEAVYSKRRELKRDVGGRKLRGLKRDLREPRRTPFRIPKLERVEPQSRSGRTYYYSAVFRNAVVLRLLTKKLTRELRERKKDRGEPSWVFSRLIDQMDSETRSVVANIREGYGRPTTVEYVQFLGYSKGSLEEFRGDIVDLRDDGILKSVPGSSLESIGIQLTPPKNPPSPSYDHLGALKRTIREVRGEELTFEIFMELVNKTDYLLKRTVEGLRGKIIAEEEKKLKRGLEGVWRKY